MSEVFVNNQVCENCGADVRLNAAFCYNCGSQVVPDEMVEIVNEGQVSNAWFKESITEQKSEPIKMPTEPLTELKIKDKSGVELTPLASNEPPPVETEPKSVETKPAKKETKPLKTAASMRQKPKFVPKRKVEITWEKPQSAPNIWFLTVALILLILAIGSVIAMLYIR